MAHTLKTQSRHNLTRETFHVVGVYDERKDKSRARAHDAPTVLVSYTPTQKGYAQRCTHPDAQGLNNDYVSDECFENLNEWMMVDYGSSFTVFGSLEAAEADLRRRAPFV